MAEMHKKRRDLHHGAKHSGFILNDKGNHTDRSKSPYKPNTKAATPKTPTKKTPKVGRPKGKSSTKISLNVPLAESNQTRGDR